MYRLSLVGLLCLSFHLPAAPVPEPPAPIKGSVPTFLNLSKAKFEGNALLVEVVEYVPVTRAIAVEVEKGGVKVVETRTVTEMVPVVKVVKYDLPTFDIVTAEGKALSLETALPLLKNAGIVLSSDGPLDPAFQKVLNKDVLILVRKVPMPQPMPKPVPQPIPPK